MSSEENISIYRTSMLEALLSMVEGREEYFYRNVCRYVSKNFNMPLDRVENMDMPYVLRHYYESMYEEHYGDKEEEWIDLLDEMIKPQGSKEYEEELQEWIDKSIRENEEELKRKGQYHKIEKLKSKSKNKINNNVEDEVKDAPKSISKDYSDFIDNPLDEPED